MSGARVVSAQFRQHLGQIFRIDLAQLLQPGDLAARNQIEIVDQPRHAGIVTIRLARLNGEAFGEIPRAHARWIERLDQDQRIFHLGQRDAQRLGHFAQRIGQVSSHVQPVDQCARDEGLGRAVGHCPDLGMEMFGQRELDRAALVDPQPLLTVAGKAFGRAPAAVAGIPVDLQLGGGKVGRCVALPRAFCDQRIGLAFLARGFSHVAAVAIAALRARCLAQFKQGIGFQRIADECLDLEIGQRQQLDRLLQLRRHHQRLRLAQVEARSE